MVNKVREHLSAAATALGIIVTAALVAITFLVALASYGVL